MGNNSLTSQVWSESPDGSGAVNFLTGMGGFLQAVLFGYTGFRSGLFPSQLEIMNCGNNTLSCLHNDFFFFKVVHSHFRIHKEQLAFKPLLPSGLSELCIRGVSYLGNKMDWLLRKEEVCIILREQSTSAAEAKACALQVVLQGSGEEIPLIPGTKQQSYRLLE